MSKLNVRWLGYLPYHEALTLQKGLHDYVSESTNHSDYLLLLEHDSVITKGRTTKASNILESEETLASKGIEVYDVDRGGDVTFHGKGQLVGYPILRLEDPKRVIPYVRSLEKVIIQTLASCGIESWNDDAATGVWTREGKVASIGIKVSKGITSHGFSINVKSCEEYFQKIIPCGIPNLAITSIDEENGDITDLSKLENIIADSVSENFHVPIIWKNTLTLSSI